MNTDEQNLMKLQVPEQLVKALTKANRIVIASHIHPDGDAFGSSAALAWALHGLGKEVAVYNCNGLPDYLDFLTFPCALVQEPKELPFEPDLIAVLDCGSAERLGEKMAPLLRRYPVILVDHHLNNKIQATEGKWVVPEMSSTGEMVAMILEKMNISYSGAVGESLYVAIASDTGNFRYSCTTKNTFGYVQKLMEAGLPLADINDKMDKTWTERRFRLFGEVFSHARVEENGKIIAGFITIELMGKYNAVNSDTEGLVEMLRKLKTSRVSLTLREENRSGGIWTHVSLRSSGMDNVAEIAAKFGGGGHINAAACYLPHTAEKTFALMLPTIRELCRAG